MTKAKHGICIAALTMALASPLAFADDSAGTVAGFFEALLAQLQALWLGDAAPVVDTLTAPAVNTPGDQPELGPAALPNG